MRLSRQTSAVLPVSRASVAEESRGVATPAGAGRIDDEQVAGGEVALYLVGQMLEIMVVGEIGRASCRERV